jgi:Ca2+-binding RTX toxin-like protein
MRFARDGRTPVGTTRRSVIRSRRVGVSLAAAALALPSSAWAAEASVSGGTLLYDGGVGGQNVVISRDGGRYVVVEGDSIITAGNGCSKVSSGRVECSASGVSRISVSLGGGDDRVRISTGVTIPTRLAGGPGVDVLIGGDSPDTFVGGDDGVSFEPEGADMDGRGGIDTVTYATGHTANITVALDDIRNDGFAGQPPDNVRSTIENIVGGPRSDLLIGDADSNVIEGGPGDDDLRGGAGDDILDGGVDSGSPRPDKLQGNTGFDTVTYAGRTEPLRIRLDDQPNDGALDGIEADNIQTTEKVVGGSGPDIMTGNNLDNTLDGGPGDDQLTALGGDDVLEGGRGADNLDGGSEPIVQAGVEVPGRDTLSYRGRLTGVTITFSDIGSGVVHPDGDRFLRIEDVIGSNGADEITADAAANRLVGGPGEDVLRGAGGDDTIDANDGVADTVGCGEGIDTAIVDLKDTFLGAGCENQEVAPVRQHPNVRVAQSAPHLAADGVVRVALYCPRALRRGCQGVLEARAVRGSGRTTLLGSARYSLRRGRTRVVGIPLSRAGEAILRALPGRRLRLIARERDFRGRAKVTVATRSARLAARRVQVRFTG